MKKKYKPHHQLPRRGLLWRVAMTTALVASAVLFFETQAIVDILVGEATGIRHTMGASAQMLAWLAWMNPQYYVMAAVVHFVGLGVEAAVLRNLLGRVSLRRRMLGFLRATIVALFAIDLLAWVLLPFREVALSAAGFIEFVTTWSYVALALVPLKAMWIFERWAKAPDKPLEVVVVGGGFAGLYTALGIDKRLGYHDSLKMTLVDVRNYFLFPPLLPSAASGAIEVRQVTYPFRRLLENSNIGFKKAEVVHVDVATRQITMRVDTRKGPTTSVIKYDALVLAPGSVTQTFGTPGVEEHGFFMRELQDAVAVRNQVVDCFERAAALVSQPANDEGFAVKALLTFVVVGAGPTGVELATELIDLIHNVLLKSYAEIEDSLPRVVLVQSAPQILPGWDAALVKATTRQLKSLGVELLLDAAVASVAFDVVTLKDGTAIAARTCAWCAGVKAHPLLAASGLPLGPGGRVTVGPDLRVPGHPDVFVLGDAAVCIDPKTQKPLPPIGQVAFQQGTYAARAIVRILKRLPPTPFKYFDFGQLVSAGEHFAAVKLLGLRFSGRIAWVVWRALYLSKLVGTSTRFRVLVDWLLDLLIERSIAQIHTRAPKDGEQEKKKAA
jgi:NADH dehydrogenase